MNKNKELVKNTAIISIGKICTQFLSFLLLPLYTSLLTTKDYGTVDLITTYQQLLGYIVFFQIEQAVFEPEISRKKLSCDYLVKVTEEFVSYDETKVREILLNIIGNSVKYTPDGGNISVRVEQISKGDQGSASYRFTVADTGIGMSEEYLPHIFEEFTRERTSTETRVEGTGLGLPIVKSLVDMMGGSIDVQSKVGVGTTTTIVLTFAVATNTEVLTSMDQSWENIADRLCGMRILMAEDNDLNAELAVTLLGERGILVDRAVDGLSLIHI